MWIQNRPGAPFGPLSTGICGFLFVFSFHVAGTSIYLYSSIAMENGPSIKIYLLLKMMIFNCHVSLPKSTFHSAGNSLFAKSKTFVTEIENGTSTRKQWRWSGAPCWLAWVYAAFKRTSSWRDSLPNHLGFRTARCGT